MLEEATTLINTSKPGCLVFSSMACTIDWSSEDISLGGLAFSSSSLDSGGLTKAPSTSPALDSTASKPRELVLPSLFLLAKEVAFLRHPGSADRRRIWIPAPSSLVRVDKAFRSDCMVSRFKS